MERPAGFALGVTVDAELFKVAGPLESDRASAKTYGPYCIILVSAGWNKEGGAYIQDWMLSVDFAQLWHRVDLVFDDREHLDWYGTDTRAQSQFKRLYPHHKKYFRALEPYILRCTFKAATAHMFLCKSGHHRSPAFVELLGADLEERHPGVLVRKWHLDHNRRAFGKVWNLAAFQQLGEEDQETELEFPIVDAVYASREQPLLLLHRLRLTSANHNSSACATVARR